MSCVFYYRDRAMAKTLNGYLFLVLAIILLSIGPTEQLQSSQAETLRRIQYLLDNPPVLSGWKDGTDFCNTEPNSSLTIVCYEESVTQLIIIGENGAPALPQNFSMDSFVTTLVKLPNLKVLTLVSLGLWGPLSGKIARLSSLEIFNVSSNFLYGALPHELSFLKSLQTLILDKNMFSGPLPDWTGKLLNLTVLSLRQNSFNGSLPDALNNLESLRVLSLSHNHFSDEVPDLSSLRNLQVLDLEDNAFEGQFPKLDNRLVTLILSKNKFRSGIPSELSSYYQLEHLDISFNSFVGPFLHSLLVLPTIIYLNIAGNKLTGMLSENQSCNDELTFVDLSSNLLTGSLPDCLSDSKKRDVSYAKNCLAAEDQDQQPLSFCRNEALAVGIVPGQKKRKQATKTVLALGIVGGTLGGILLVGLIFLAIRRTNARKPKKSPPTRLITENASTGSGYTSKLFTDARYISQSMKLGALGLPPYRTYSLEEIEEATGNFDTSAFIGEGSHGQMYRGQLKNGSLLAIKCLKIKKSQSIQHFMHHIELISKLRHRHVVSALGHCFECYWDDSSVSRIFLVFEYVPNGTLRSWISGRRGRQSLTWSQRIGATIGLAKGIQFLHTGIVPGLYSNNLKITDILVDQNLVAKISSYSLPLLAEMVKEGSKMPSGGSKEIIARMKHQDKTDIYDFGVILLEIISGRPFKSNSEVDVVKDQLQSSMMGDDTTRRSSVDSSVRRACSDQSLRTMMEICVRCLNKEPTDRPSIEDVLWNLQFAAQVQDAWRGDSQSSEGSPTSPSRQPSLHLSIG
ncbi:probable inactive leucine-rich repeat receptor-like protein kinase At3g03770 [Eucalyptus grandis]|uniref:probable inactive leucine-rich repeat receptor-like protein kinase At3g03770 n=1 Tax=Eucalyptus grandis TaxID=71139 RepID=UPI00192EFE58|nr:probable inactive leucine-rich repeat receptor-like protein kinase At3g03770 [Eucalyptus grandis]XP_010036250.2 probable inactive leucine-rich repeat receptor-like protein kinase At3g03770 [Eucalyptus grandis]XP_010036251.2 probable inactive leucine-rich repeat receptor-like protein kinase At3g03770 [Eucalyptus grandis]XP_010036252.2 probable inactive leucine-rich repeat receptor-like protein kinase At3g03770 [Eucalyptus grandis]XP_039162500.1 probable inactive leucine-rich repeat receptor-l